GKALRDFEGHTGLVTAAALSDDGKWLVTGSSDQTARLWDAVSGKEIQTFKGHTSAVSFVALSRDARWLVAGGADAIRVWDLAAGKEVHTLPEGDVQSWSVSADGKWLATARATYPPKLWDLQTGSEVRSFLGEEAWVALAAPAVGASRLFT